MLGALTASSRGTLVTANAAAHTKGVYAQIVAATAAYSTWILLIMGAGSSAAGFLVDIATGPAGSEVVKITNIFYTSNNSANGGTSVILLPLKIVAGSRIAARCQCATAGSKTLDVEVVLLDGVGGGLTTIETCGADTATSYGIQVNDGGAPHTKGSWTQIIAATSGAYKYFVVLTPATCYGAIYGLLDIGIGAAGVEAVLVANLQMGNNGQSEHVFPLPLTIAAGTRIAARLQTSDGTGHQHVEVIGVY